MMNMGYALEPHQDRVVQRMVEEGVRGLIAAHSDGSGQMSTACVIANKLLSQGVVENVLVLTTRSKLSKWIKEAYTKRLVKLIASKVMQVVEGRRWLSAFHDGSAKITSNTFIVVDEAHSMRKKISQKMIVRGKCLENDLLNVCASPHVTRILLFSDTSVMNYKLDVTNLALMLRGTAWSENMPDINALTDRAWLTPLIDYHVQETDDDLTPRIDQEIIKLVMSPECLQHYMITEARQHNESQLVHDDTCDFMEKLRGQVSIGHAPAMQGGELPPLSQKMTWLSQRFHEWIVVDKSKMCIFSAQEQFDVDTLRRMLNRMGIKVEVIDGTRSASQIKVSVDNYNRDSNQMRVIVFTGRATNEEFELRGTDYLVMLEPHWNNAVNNQAIKKVATVNSHTHVSEIRKLVRVKHLVLTKPYDIEFDYKSSDDYIMDQRFKPNSLEPQKPVLGTNKRMKVDRIAHTSAARAVMRVMTKKKPTSAVHARSYVPPQKAKLELVPLDLMTELI